MAVQINENNVEMLLQQLRHILKAGGIGGKFTDLASSASGKHFDCGAAVVLVRAKQRNR
jgi:hypothetical protein